MARNHEKQYGKLNRLILSKEKDEFEKANPKRPRLDLLDSPEEIQKWIPSIKKDIDFYLKKSQVPCYSDQQIEDCKEQINKLEREFKAFIRKIKNLTPGVLDAIPWTSRPYKRKKIDSMDVVSRKEFKPIDTPLLTEIKKDTEQKYDVDLQFMNEPLTFNSTSSDLNEIKGCASASFKQPELALSKQTEDFYALENSLLKHNEAFDIDPTIKKKEISVKINQQKEFFNDDKTSKPNSISFLDYKKSNNLDSNLYCKSILNDNTQIYDLNTNKMNPTIELKEHSSQMLSKLVDYNCSDSDNSN